MNKKMKTIFLLTTILILLVGISCAAANTDNTTTKIKTTDTTKQIQSTTSKDTKKVENKNTDNKKTINKTKTKNVKKAPVREIKVNDSNYDSHFDKYSTLKTNTIGNGSTITFSGDIKNKDFTFDNTQVTVKNDGTSTLYNTTITVQNNAKITFDGLKINNFNKEQEGQEYTILLESKGNTIKNSEIKVINEDNPVKTILIAEDNNQIINTKINTTTPSVNVDYHEIYVGESYASGIFIKSSNNLVKNCQIYYDGEEYNQIKDSDATVDGIDIQSKGEKFWITGNTINNTSVKVLGGKFAYGINIGRAKNTKLDSNNINVTSKYYSSAIQIFDNDDTKISGKIYSKATEEAYGLYTTAMAIGVSRNVNLNKLDMEVEAPKSRAVLIEGGSNTNITDSTYKVKGSNATAIICQQDYKNNTPVGLNIKNVIVTLERDDTSNIMAFYRCANVTITDSTFASENGKEIIFIECNGSIVRENYIKIDNGEKIGDEAVITDNPKDIIEFNTPKSYAQLQKENTRFINTINEQNKTITQQNKNITDLKNQNNNLTKEKNKLEEKVKQLNKKISENTKLKTKVTIKKITTAIGKTVTLTANIKDSKSKAVTSGKVLFKVNNAALKDSNKNILYANVVKGKASIKYTVPASWIKKAPKIQAIYYGDDKYQNSNITKTGIIKVNKGTNKITISPSTKTIQAGKKITFTIKHIDSNTKKGLNSKVVLKVNGKKITVKVKNGEGKTSYTVPRGSDAQTIKATATYSSKVYKKTTASTTFKVVKTTPTIKITKITYKNKKTTVKANLNDATNKLLNKNVKVTIKVDGKVVLKNKVVKNGKLTSSFKKALKKGNHKLLITNSATKAFNSAKLSTNFKT